MGTGKIVELVKLAGLFLRAAEMWDNGYKVIK